MSDEKPAAPPKPRWLSFLESRSGTALITVVIGGLAGQLITCSIQNQMKDREFQQAWLQARGNQALVAYKEYLDREQQIVEQAYELIGNYISASEDLITLTKPEFDLERYSGDQRRVVAEQRTAIRQWFNTMDAKWRGEHEWLGLLMSFYHRGRQDVTTAWRELEDSVTEYADCTRRWYVEHSAPVTPAQAEEACKAESQLLRQRLDELSASMEAARQYAWEGWESPEKMRSALEKK